MTSERPLFWFITAAAFWAAGFSMAVVLMVWLLVDRLGGGAGWVGVLQSMWMIPSFLLVLFGGVLTDRYDRRRLLLIMFSIATILSFAVAGMVAVDRIGLPVVLAFAGGLGTLAAFVVPARDAMVSDVSPDNLMRAVILVNMVHWGMQAVGALLASGARWAGMNIMLLLMAMLFVGAIVAISRVPKAPPSTAGGRRLSWDDLVGGFREVWHSVDLLPTFLLNSAVGVFFVGPYMVAFPLLVRDIYQGDVALLGWLNMSFPIGIILGSIMMLRRGKVQRKGLAQVMALYIGCVFFGCLALNLPFWGACLVVVFWGAAAAVFMNSGRTIFQEKASSQQLGRVLAVYSLALTGATGLVGAPLAGFLAEQIGVLATLAMNAGAMVLAVLLAQFLTPVLKIE